MPKKFDPMGGPPQRHPAYGTITTSRVSGGSYLFGSEARHQYFIRLRIGAAYVRRNLYEDRTYSENRDYIEVDMSEAQWAHFVSSMNMGGGTACTIVYLNGEKVEDLPKPENKADKFSVDIQEHLDDLVERVQALRDAVKEQADKPRKGELQKVARDLDLLAGSLAANLNFASKQFHENMENTMLEARQTIESYFINRVHELGLQAAVAAMPLSLPGNEAEPERPDSQQRLQPEDIWEPSKQSGEQHGPGSYAETEYLREP